MNYFLAIICPPLSVFLSHSKGQAFVSLILFGLAILAMYGASSGAFMPGYAAGPVVYVVAIIHAFVIAHRFYQQKSGQTHPHRGTKTQSKL